MRRPALAALAAALALTACQEPTGVGLGLIDAEQSNPNVRTVPLADLDTVQTETVTIGFAATSQTPVQARVLVGDVADPAFGDVRAVAYVDFLQPDVDGLEASDVTGAWLELSRDYVYGDTTAALDVELRAIDGSWMVDTDYPQDTLFATGPLLSTTTVTVADSLRRFDLPASWVSDQAATLVGDGFGDAFEGFALSVQPSMTGSPGAVFGFSTFSTSGSGLRVATREDTLFYPLSEVFTSLASARPTASGSVLPVRASTRQGLCFTAPLDSIPTTALARAEIRLPLELAVTQEGSFVRPVAQAALLIGIRLNDAGEESRVALGQLDIDEGTAVLSDAATLTNAIQALLVDPTRSRFVRYEVIPIGSTTTNAVSLDVLPIPLAPPAAPPRLTLTLVGADS